MPPADLEVVGVVRGGHLQNPGAEIQRHVAVADHRDLPVHQREDDPLPYAVAVPFILRVHREGGVPQHRLGPGGGHDQEFPAPIDRVPDVIEVPRVLLVFHFQVGEGGLTPGTPVDDVIAAVDQAVPVKSDEDFPHGTGKAFVHGEPLPAPVAGTPQLLQLVRDLPAKLLFPLPDPGDKRVPAEPVAVGAFPGELFFHHVLGRDSGVVGSGQPEHVEPVHAFIPGENILKGVVQGVAHVERAGHVRGRDDDGKRRAGGIFIGPEQVLLFPEGIPFIFYLMGIVNFRPFA